MELAEGDDEMIDEALKQYSYVGVAHAKQIFARTRELSPDFAPKGDPASRCCITGRTLSILLLEARELHFLHMAIVT
jgi:hypothetical protein